MKRRIAHDPFDPDGDAETMSHSTLQSEWFHKLFCNLDARYCHNPDVVVAPANAAVAEPRRFVSPLLGVYFDFSAELEISRPDSSPFVTLRKLYDRMEATNEIHRLREALRTAGIDSDTVSPPG